MRLIPEGLKNRKRLPDAENHNNIGSLLILPLRLSH